MAAASCLERCWARQNAKLLLLLVFYLLWLQKSQALSRLNTELQWFTQNKQIQYKSCKLREIMRWCPDAISVYIRFDCVVKCNCDWTCTRIKPKTRKLLNLSTHPALCPAFAVPQSIFWSPWLAGEDAATLQQVKSSKALPRFRCHMFVSCEN